MTSRDVRRAFWREHPHLSRRKIPDYSGTGKMYCTDTRCAFADFVDALQRDGMVSDAVANRVTLSGE